MERRTGNPVVLNTSLNRRGEPIVCTPTDALNMFYGSELQYLIMEDILITKD
jgi:carbamoyltransferase